MTTTLAVTGITGHSGRFFLQELEKHDFNGIIRCLVRETSNTELLDISPLKNNIEKLVGDYNDYSTLLKLTAGADIVMHISNIRQSLNVLKASIENKVAKLVMVHTTGVYSKFKMASSEYKQIEKEIEQKVLAASEESSTINSNANISIRIDNSTNKSNKHIEVIILRPTMIFGDLCDHNISKFIRMVDKFPFMPEINRGQGKIRPVNARDLAKAYYTVCMSEKRLPELYYDLSGERSLTLHELFDLIGKYLGKKSVKHIKHISCPMWLGTTGARLLKIMTLGRVDLVEKVLRMGEDRDYNHDKATRDFGYEPESFNVGLKREVEQYLLSQKF